MVQYVLVTEKTIFKNSHTFRKSEQSKLSRNMDSVMNFKGRIINYAQIQIW